MPLLWCGFCLEHQLLVEIPKVAGQTVAEAKENLKKANFEIGEEKTEASDTVEEGRVIRTDPDAGSARKEGSKVNLIISSGQQSFKLGIMLVVNLQMSLLS